ncbi:tRNA uridine-5-carboxymethylaminomethyl(34) synthesis GTPase MnmE [Pelagibius sp.]|uniref:tRNA uridine-5-carboxymethylaminomethyl(34) synthesis GTPase MnmE n=1 Tax=Pelagibius sp. TaxID=1931238 RepID=UPI003B50EC37
MDNERQAETVFAPSTAPGRAGVAVVRLSGPEAGAALRALTGAELPPPRRAALRRLCDPADHAPIDQALVLWFPGPGSFTGEDMAELQVHGGRAVMAAVLQCLARLPGLRPAEAGEFTRRAFDNGKLDLTAVEGLADLIDAETEAQRRQALRQMEGGLARRTAEWSARLTRVLAYAEAAIDFADEDLPEAMEAEALEAAAAVAAEIRAALADGRRGERLRDGLAAVILGPPNAGKSSLLNALAEREVAIVSETAGTTRDVIEVHLDLGGYPVTLADTAGLRTLAAERPRVAAGGSGPAVGVAEAPWDRAPLDPAPLDPAPLDSAQGDIEREGMARARQRAEAADLKVLVFDLAAERSPRRGMAMAEADLLGFADHRSLLVLNKADLVSPAAADAAAERMTAVAGAAPIVVSARSGAGLDALLAALIRQAEDCFAGGTAEITRARQRRALEDGLAALERVGTAGLPELRAEDLRLAVRALGRVTGRVDVEDLLDIVFQDFCIGK